MLPQNNCPEKSDIKAMMKNLKRTQSLLFSMDAQEETEHGYTTTLIERKQNKVSTLQQTYISKH